MTPKPLTTIRIERYSEGDTHDEITVSTALERAADDNVEWAAFGPPTDEDLHEALTYLRGVFGRLAAVAGDWITAEARWHGCKAYSVPLDGEGRVVEIGDPSAFAIDVRGVDGGDACGLTPVGLVRNHRNPNRIADYPTVYFHVPNAHVKLWIKRVKHWLAEIDATDDAGGPTS